MIDDSDWWWGWGWLVIGENDCGDCDDYEGDDDWWWLMMIDADDYDDNFDDVLEVLGIYDVTMMMEVRMMIVTMI